MVCEKLFAQIDCLNEEYLQVWEDVVNIESPTAFKEGVDAVGRYFVEKARNKGWQVEIAPQEVSGDVICITMNPDSEEQPVALSGHLDTVHPVGLFGSPAARRDATKLYGPGAVDCKGGVVAAFMAMDALDRCGYKKRPVQLLLQTDEEVGSMSSNKQTIGWICEKAKNAVAFLNTEGHSRGTATLQRKGIARYRFTITGKAEHSAKCFLGANAIAQAAHMILELEKFKDEQTLTCNCGLISGGTTPNTVPAHCTFVADFRYATDADLQRALDKINEVASTAYVPGCSCQYHQLSYRTAMPLCQRNLDLLDKANEIFAREGLPTLTVTKSPGGSDAADVTAAGIPCLDNLGVGGGRIHSKDEFGLLSSLAASAKYLAAVAYVI